MSKILITNYLIGWNPITKRGDIRLKLQNGQIQIVPVSTAEEFAAISMILNESPVFLDDQGFIGTAEWEPVSET